jgi:branched-chain amino acid transport system substrate-binding protein
MPSVSPTKAARFPSLGGSMTTLVRRLSLAILMVLPVVVSRPASAQDTIKLGYIEALSGPFSSAGDEALKIFGYILEKINAQGGALGKKFELVPFDD